MAWGKVRGTQKGGLEKNYPGYVIRYGSKTFTEIKSLGYIPLTVYVPLYLGFSDATYNYTWFKINNANVYSLNARCWGNGQGGDAYCSSNYDLDHHFKGDLEAMKNCTISSGTIIKWLVPEEDIISDGKLWLYRDGWINEELTGGITLNNVTNTNGKLNFAVGLPSDFIFNNLIPTAGYKLCIEFVNNYVGGGQYFLVWQDKNYPCISLSKQYTNSSNRINTVKIDTKSEPTQAKCSISYGAVGDCITKIWLE